MTKDYKMYVYIRTVYSKSSKSDWKDYYEASGYKVKIEKRKDTKREAWDININ